MYTSALVMHLFLVILLVTPVMIVFTNSILVTCGLYIAYSFAFLLIYGLKMVCEMSNFAMFTSASVMHLCRSVLHLGELLVNLIILKMLLWVITFVKI